MIIPAGDPVKSGPRGKFPQARYMVRLDARVVGILSGPIRAIFIREKKILTFAPPHVGKFFLLRRFLLRPCPQSPHSLRCDASALPMLAVGERNLAATMSQRRDEGGSTMNPRAPRPCFSSPTAAPPNHVGCHA